MKKIIKSFLFFTLFIFSILRAFALDANISLDNNKININDYVKLKISISSLEGGEIDIKKITGVDDFKIVGTSQSQSSYSNVVIVDGKTKTQTKMTNDFYVNLEAKKTGNFTLGPVIIDDGKTEIKTNVVSIEVSGTKMFLNNTKPKNRVDNLNQKINKKIEENNENIDFKENNLVYYLGIIFIIVLIFIGIIYLLFKKNKEKILVYIQKKLGDGKEKNLEVNLGINSEIKNINFEKKMQIINYPEITDNLFGEKIDKIFKDKIGKKFNILNIENKTYDEILKLLEFEVNKKDKEKVILIIELLKKMKYSNLVANKSKLLESIRNLFE